ncbi:MAG: deoxyribonuclease V [Dehalococcoidia bacterium]|nr:deoxyribonuclease V [Dehalococcoidia bacterium]
MEVRNLHRWDLTPREAADLQRRMAGLVESTGDPSNVRRVAGVDIVAGARGSLARGAVVVLSYPELELIESHAVESLAPYPYVPGLLSFREIPVLIPALERVQAKVDLVVVDGHGYSHPRRFGLACHLGYLLDLPTIGCAKSRLVGSTEGPGPARGDRAPLFHEGEVIGEVLRTKERARPLYVSVGHRISLAAATEWVLRLAAKRRITEPIRLADLASRTGSR